MSSKNTKILQKSANKLLEEICENLTDGSLTEFLTEGSRRDMRGITYYDLRKFLEVVRRTTRDNNLENMLEDLLKTLAKLEVRSVPVPAMRRISGRSPVIFHFPQPEDYTQAGE